MSRLDYSIKNIKYGYIASIVNALAGFVTRTIFIKTLGTDYLGVNGLYANVLGMLSFAELGIGSAMNYSLYKPVANGDKEKIKSLMYLYKKAYRFVTLIIFAIGIAIVPLISYVIKDAGELSHDELVTYYLIFLFNTSVSYLVSYKFSLSNAEQKNYIQTNINTVGKIIINIAQIFVLLIWRNYFAFLLTQSIVQLLQHVFTVYYFDKYYPLLKEKNILPLSKEEKKPIVKNIKALILHNLAGVAVYQTDNILISSFISLSVVGIVSNYLMIIAFGTSLVSIIFNSVVSSFGNLIATESIEKQHKTFRTYRFLAFWIYGLTAILFYILLTPFVTLWIGADKTIGNSVVALLAVNYYITGQRNALLIFRNAAGAYSNDKYVAVVEAIVNLIASIFLGKYMGLTGIYLGTIISGLVSALMRPVIIYNDLFKISSKEYYKDACFFIVVLLLPTIALRTIQKYIFTKPSIATLIFLGFLVLIIVNLTIIITTRKREEYQQIKMIIEEKVFKRILPSKRKSTK